VRRLDFTERLRSRLTKLCRRRFLAPSVFGIFRSLDFSYTTYVGYYKSFGQSYESSPIFDGKQGLVRA
jgi:hypothetical protein